MDEWYSCISACLSCSVGEPAYPVYLNHYSWEVSADAKGTFTIMLEAMDEYNKLKDPTGTSYLPLNRIPGYITIETGKCCYTLGEFTTQCTDGVTVCECEALPGPRAFKTGVVCDWAGGYPYGCFGPEAKRPMPEDCATVGAGTKCNATGTCTTDADCWQESHCVPAPTGESGSGICYAPKTRYLSIGLNPEQTFHTARRIKLDDGTELGWVGEPYYVQPVQEEPPGIYLADIVATPHYEPMWPGVVHVTGCEIAHAALCDVSGIHCKPNSCPAGETCVQHSYYIQVIKLGDDISDESNYSEVLELRTNSTWGDTVSTIVLDNARPPEGIVGIDDIMAAIRKYQHIDVAPITWLDIDPSTGASTPDQRIGLDDVMSYIDAYQGGSYPGLGPLNCP